MQDRMGEGRSLLLHTGRDSPPGFIGVSIMSLLPPNVKSTPFAGMISTKINLLTWCFVLNGGGIYDQKRACTCF